MKNIIYGDSTVTLADSLYITLVCMLIVFVILIIICISLYLLKGFSKDTPKLEEEKLNKKVDKKLNKSETVSEKEYEFKNLKYNVDDEGVRLAIITSCIHATEEFGHNNIKINYVKEL